MNSMTGFGRGVKESKGVRYSVEISSVNHKYFDVSFRMPGSMNEYQSKLRELLHARIDRGHIEVNIFAWENKEEKEIIVNSKLARKYFGALSGLGKTLKLKGGISIDQILKFNDIIRTTEHKETSFPALKEAFETAVKGLTAARKNEGAKVWKDISARTGSLSRMLDTIIKINARIMPEKKKAVTEKLQEIFKGVEKIDQNRICAEASLLVERADISEEIARLSGHIEEFKRIAGENKPAGRKFDFLLQEFMREINTIGSKCNTNEISHVVVAFKEELEKVREQVQNVE